MSIIKGQNLRLFLDSYAIIKSTSCTVNISADLEEVNHKDVDGIWKEQECVGKSWDCSFEGLFNDDSEPGDEYNSISIQGLLGTVVEVEFVETTGDNNRERTGAYYYGGTAIVTSISFTSGNKQDATVSVSLQGTGSLTKTARLQTQAEE